MAVDRWIDDGVVKVQAGFLNAGVPVAGVLFKLTIKFWVSTQRTAKRGFVVRSTPHPAVAQARPFGDGIALLAQVIGTSRDAEKLVGIAAAAGVGTPAQGVLQFGFVQRIVHLGDRSGCVAKSWMRSHVFNTLTVNIDFAAVLQALQILFTS